jgi:hypothetical protein
MILPPDFFNRCVSAGEATSRLILETEADPTIKLIRYRAVNTAQTPVG